jgi:protein-L-isoaspartate(D-aspartate) O-methyltransferase
MNEVLKLEVGQKVLEIGSGCGWHAATVAEIIGPASISKEKKGHVYTVEIKPKLAEICRKNIEKAGYGDQVTVICGDGSKGYSQQAPFDRIYVTAAAPDIPKPLIDQLKPKGILVIPVGRIGYYQKLLRLRKINSNIKREELGGVAFVPLIGMYGHKNFRFEGY